MDVVYIAFIALLGLAILGFAWGCARLQGRGERK